MTRLAHRTIARRSTACLLVTAAVLTAACSNTDPTAPRASTAVRTPTSGPVHSGYVVAWGRGDSTGSASANSGYVVAWGKDGGNTGDATANSGYVVAWGKDGGDPGQQQTGTN